MRPSRGVRARSTAKGVFLGVRAHSPAAGTSVGFAGDDDAARPR
jgi:hypothetical protein